MIHWVLELQPVGARGFAVESQEEAEELCAGQEPYPASCNITQIRHGVVTLTMLHSDRTVRIVLADIVRLARELHRHGVKHLYYERRIGRLAPLAQIVTDGPMSGMYYVDVAMVVAGSDGDY